MSWIIINTSRQDDVFYAGGDDKIDDIVWVNSGEYAFKFNCKLYADEFIYRFMDKNCISIECKG